MKKYLQYIYAVLILAMGCWSSQNKVSVSDHDQVQQKDRQRYVLKVGAGEFAGLSGEKNILIKASPKSGTGEAVLILQPMTRGFSTGLHYHEKADELFYVLAGSGQATIDDTKYEIGAGDVIFIPTGNDHKIVASSDLLEVLAFVDKPGLDEEFRAYHHRFDEQVIPVTLEELNKIANKYGTVYKTLK